ncbi:thiamine-phosphate kinase [Candidatus Methanomethylophilus sp. 1R26]|uniref:thiamine-phosphate kinase n=1 Tax=Candidatus Methanomethylophilus sp. 1R26 TaxID=1769296 RepID=UPI0009EB6A18|nr:thiamine-phosphate kinase [Candidatus Methanomethylophilus sp. 1R26]
MATLETIGERRLIERMLSVCRPRQGGTTVIGPGDDAAVIGGLSDGRIAATTDSVSVARHKTPGMNWEQFGWTAAAVNFSDLAAMGARPVGLLAAMDMPGDMEEADFLDIASGIDQCCEFCGTEVVGGDTKPGPGTVTATALGSFEGRKPMTRSGARPGDVVAVTGCIGEAAAGFLAEQNSLEGFDDAEFAFRVPVPRWEEGMAMAGTGIVTSCMDLSDGLGNACRAVCAASHAGMEIEWEFLPLGEDTEEVCRLCRKDLRETALRWGGDYELLFTFDPKDIDALYKAGVAFSIIGSVDNGRGAFIAEGGDRREMPDGIY